MAPRLAHIGIAVHSLGDGVRTYAALLGVAAGDISYEESDAEQVRVAFVDLPNCRVELLEPTGPESPVARFLDAKGEGVHHLCFEASGDLEAERERLQAGDFRIVKRAEGHYFFIHPKDARGCLIEFYSQGSARREDRDEE